MAGDRFQSLVSLKLKDSNILAKREATAIN